MQDTLGSISTLRSKSMRCISHFIADMIPIDQRTTESLCQTALRNTQADEANWQAKLCSVKKWHDH